MIGVCIKYFHNNYGGMLQAYATISLLEARGLEYELIRYEKKISIIFIIKSLPRLINRVLLDDKYQTLMKKIGKMRSLEFAKNEIIRLNAFGKFMNDHFKKLSPVFKGYAQLCKGATRYNAVITGSDQLWSPAGLPTNYYNLKFVPDNIRKISYASSFGVRDIPWYQKRRTADFLNRIEFISMREKRGAEIVEELTGRKVPIILDPVLMFNKKEWEELIPVKKEFNEPYIFAYFLGKNPIHRKVVKELAIDLGIKIVALRHLDQYVIGDEDFGDFAPYDVGPDRFLNLIRGAAYICTDSYHGTCFSIIHEKKFMVFNRYDDNVRYSKNSRIDTLCEILGLQNRRFNNEKTLLEQILEPINYHDVYQKLNVLKREANNYLDEALNGL